MATRTLAEIAKTIRSKNAGVDRITFDLIFAERADYELVRRSGVVSRSAVCRIFGIEDSRITDYVEFDPALAIKFTISRSTIAERCTHGQVLKLTSMYFAMISSLRGVE